MFWGLKMRHNEEYKWTVQKSFHVSMASMEGCLMKSSDARVIFEIIEPCGLRCHQLCRFYGMNILNIPLDLNFEKGSKVSFRLDSQYPLIVHLSGHHMRELHN